MTRSVCRFQQSRVPAIRTMLAIAPLLAGLASAASAATWTLQGTVEQGAAVSSVVEAGDTLFVSTSALGPGAVFLYTRSGDTWTLNGSLTGGSTANGSAFGASMAMADGRLFVGATAESIDGRQGQGAVYVFEQIGGIWTRTHKLVDPTGLAGDAFGHALAASGETVAVGAPGTVNTAHGKVSAWQLLGGSWQHQHLQGPPVGCAGAISGARFGLRIAMTGNRLVAGTSENSSTCGAVRDYLRESEDQPWIAMGIVPHIVHRFVNSMALDENSLVWGYGRGGTNYSGEVGEVLSSNGADWDFSRLLPRRDPRQMEFMGGSMHVSGDLLVVNAPYYAAGSGSPRKGRLITYRRSGSEWMEAPDFLLHPDPAHAQLFGENFHLHANTLFVIDGQRIFEYTTQWANSDPVFSNGFEP